MRMRAVARAPDTKKLRLAKIDHLWREPVAGSELALLAPRAPSPPPPGSLPSPPPRVT